MDDSSSVYPETSNDSHIASNHQEQILFEPNHPPEYGIWRTSDATSVQRILSNTDIHIETGESVELAGSPPPKRKALLVQVALNGNYTIVSGDEVESGQNQRNEAPLDTGEAVFNTRGKNKHNPTPLKGLRTDVHRLRKLLIGECSAFLPGQELRN